MELVVCFSSKLNYQLPLFDISFYIEQNREIEGVWKQKNDICV
jgi:hypothetical protein